jgi:hypothetical protein
MKRSTGHIQNRAGRIPQEESEKEAEEKRAARVHGAPYDKIREALEELIPGFPLGQHRMNKMRKVKGGLPSKD